MKMPGNKCAAISFTFDDGSREHFDKAVPWSNEFGFHHTFFVIAGLTRERKQDPLATNRLCEWWAEVSWEEWREAARQGHEIGNHSLTHPEGGLTKIRNTQRLAEEIEASARLIAAKIGQRPASFAFPYNKSSGRLRTLVLQHHETVRKTRVRYGGGKFTLEKANALVDRAIRKGLWMVPMIHGIGRGYDALDPDVFREHLRYIKERESEIRVDTFGNISRWHRQASV